MTARLATPQFRITMASPWLRRASITGKRIHMDQIIQMSSLPGLFLLVASGLAWPDDIGLKSHSCVARDLAVVILIEAEGEAERVRPQLLADATFQVLEARKACRSGSTDQALAIYDRVIELVRDNQTPKAP
jgi:hypothetical protein